MQIEQSYDKVVLTHAEIQEALKALILTKTGRVVRGDVTVSVTPNTGFAVKEEACKPNLISRGYCWLEAPTPLNIVDVASHAASIDAAVNAARSTPHF